MDEKNLQINYKIFLEECKKNNNDQDLTIDMLLTASVIEKINNECINKDFIYILIWQLWTKKENVVSYYKYDKKKKKYIPHQSASLGTTVNNFNLFPYDYNGDDILPIIDIRDIVTVLNIGKKNNSLDDFYDQIKLRLGKETFDERIDSYIENDYIEIEKSYVCAYVEFLKAINEDYRTYTVSCKDANNNFKKPYFFDTLKFGKLSEDFINKKIEYISNDDNLNVSDEISRYGMIDKISTIAGRIVKIIHVFLNYVQDVFNLIRKNQEKKKKGKNDQQEQIENINITSSLGLRSQTSLSVDKMIELAKPKIKPLFKKAYIARENNLSAYIKIKMLYYPLIERNKKEENEKQYTEINNFDIPYNNITNLEHNIEEEKLTIGLIDTEGNIAELLIHKMYAYFNSNDQYVKMNSNKDANASLPYVFEIEYGWSGPKTDDEEELLEENVFVKKTFRGYIKSIASKFSFKGNEYTLELIKNNPQIIASYGNYYELFYVTNRETYGICLAIGLVLINFIFKYSNDDTQKYFNKKNVNGSYQTNDSLMQKIFIDLDDVSNKLCIQKVDNSTYRFIFFNGTKMEILTDDITKKQPSDKNKNTTIQKILNNFLFIEKILKKQTLKTHTFPKGTKPEKIEYFEVLDLKIEDIKEMEYEDEDEFVLNGWIVSVYLIWKIKKFFIKTDKKNFIALDTIGIFDIFKYDEENFLDIEKIKEIIKSFNVLGVPKHIDLQIHDINITDIKNVPYYLRDEKNIFIFYRIRSHHSVYYQTNKFNLSKLIDKSIDRANINKDDTFFVKKIKQIFKSISKIELFDQDSTNFSAISADSVQVNFDTYRDVVSSQQIYDSIEREIQKNNYYHNYKNDLLDKDIMLSLFNDNLVRVSSFIESTREFNWLYIYTNTSAIKIFKSDNLSLKTKIEFLSRLLTQVYSNKPRITPKTRNSNKQFFSQGHENILNEGSGDIIEFSVDELDVQNTINVIVSNKNVKNFGFNDFSNDIFVNGLYENSAKYLRTYTDINGEPSKEKIMQDMATIELNYAQETQLNASIIILGEPYWTERSLLRNRYIYINIYYNNGSKCAHSGLYMVKNAIHTISNNKYTTKLDLIRQNTFLSNFSIKTENSITAS